MSQMNRGKVMVRGNRRRFNRKQVMPRNAKDLQQDKEIMSMKKSIKKISNEEELKHKDTLMSAIEMISDPSATQTILLNGLAQGTSQITRVGNLTKYTSIQIKGTVFNRAAGIDGSQFRIIVFWDRAANGVAPTAGQLLDLSVITNAINAPYNSFYYTRFKIVYDKIGGINPQMVTGFTPASGVTTATAQIAKPIVHRERLTRTTNYGLGSGGTISDISINSLYILLLSDKPDVANTGPLFTGGVRLNYKDA